MLSPGELQRICLARVLHRRPRLAVLDEATSSLSPEVEAMLYSRLHQAGITVFSVGHRESLCRFHSQLLVLAGDGTGMWELSRMPSSG